MDPWAVMLWPDVCAVGWLFVGRVVVSRVCRAVGPGDVTVEVVGPAYNV